MEREGGRWPFQAPSASQARRVANILAGLPRAARLSCWKRRPADIPEAIPVVHAMGGMMMMMGLRQLGDVVVVVVLEWERHRVTVRSRSTTYSTTTNPVVLLAAVRRCWAHPHLNHYAHSPAHPTSWQGPGAD